MIECNSNKKAPFPQKMRTLGYLLIISSMSKHACVTLHRPPPLTLTFDNSLLLFSSIVTFRPGFIAEALIAVKKPAAPPPMTTRCFCFILFLLIYPQEGAFQVFTAYLSLTPAIPSAQPRGKKRCENLKCTLFRNPN